MSGLLALGGPIHGRTLPDTLKDGDIWRVPVIGPPVAAYASLALPTALDYDVEEYRVRRFYVRHEGVTRHRAVAVREQDEHDIGLLLLFHYMEGEEEVR